MSVYLITCRELGMVKIGVAFNPFVRLKTLQTAFPLDLTVEALIKGAHRREKELHQQFAAHRVRGEWFRLCPEIEALIDKDNVPQRPRSEAQKRRLHQLHSDPEQFGPFAPPRHILQAFRESRLPPPDVPPAFSGMLLNRTDRQRLRAGDIHFPFRNGGSA